MEMPLVSVCMTTYNHEPYIAEAIESVLAQQTSFGVELVVGEDCSTDRTAAICREYAAKYPDRIRLVTSPENVGWRANYRRTFEACRVSAFWWVSYSEVFRLLSQACPRL